MIFLLLLIKIAKIKNLLKTFVLCTEIRYFKTTKRQRLSCMLNNEQAERGN